MKSFTSSTTSRGAGKPRTDQVFPIADNLDGFQLAPVGSSFLSVNTNNYKLTIWQTLVVQHAPNYPLFSESPNILYFLDDVITRE